MKVEAVAREAVLRFLLDRQDDRRNKALDVGDILDVAASAHDFIEHAYWKRITMMLRNSEQMELETLLDPMQADKHALSRASVANIRKLLAMPYIDIAQGESAVNAVDKHRERFGETEWRTAQQGVRHEQDA